MALFDDDQRRILEAVATLASGNPFLTERVEAERKALGEEFVATTAVWHVEADLDGLNPNVPRISRLVESLGDDLRDRLASGRGASERELTLYQIFVFYLVYERYSERWMDLIRKAGGGSSGRIRFYEPFVRDVAHFFEIPELRFPVSTDPAFLFALGFQTAVRSRAAGIEPP